jgi:putative DNA primase/helicase
MSVPSVSEIEQIKEKKVYYDNYADKIMKIHSFRTLRGSNEILVYTQNTGVYNRGGEDTINQMCQQIIPGCTNSKCREVIGVIKRRTLTPKTKFDNYTHLLNVKNGILDWNTGDLLEHSPKYLFTVQIPVRYDPTIGPVRYMKFLMECLPDLENRKKAIEMLASTVLSHIRPDKMFMNVGGGSNGKSTNLKVIERFVGSENVSNTSIHDLVNDKFATSRLDGKLTNIYADISRREISDLGTIKALVSGDSMDAQRKGQDSFKMQNTAKLIYSCNELPELGEESYAIYRRLILIEWNQRFEEQKSSENTRLANSKLLDELITEQELSGILNLVFKVGQRIRRNGKLSCSEHIPELRKKWAEKSDPIGKFLETYVEQDFETNTSKKEIHEKFREWCKRKNITPKKEKVFNQKISQQFNIRDTTARIKGKPTKVWPGIKILENVTDETDVTTLSL